MQMKFDRNMKCSLEANKVKDKLAHRGFNFAISLYGVLKNIETGHREYRRIEVFLNGVPTQIDVMSIRGFFDEILPFHYYSIWIYNIKSRKILLLKSW